MALTQTQIGVIIAICAGAVILPALLILFFTRHRNSFSFSRRPDPTAPQDIEMADLSSPPRAPSGEFGTYGNLVISPGRRPVYTALDIISHALMAFALPAGAKAVSAPQVSVRPMSITPSEFTTHVVSEAEASAAALDSERDVLRLMSMMRHQLQERKDEEAREQRSRATVFRCRDAFQSHDRTDSSIATSLSSTAAYQRSASGSRFVERFSLDLDDITVTPLDFTDLPVSQLEDVFVIESDASDAEEDIEIAVDPMSAAFGSGKAMAALYHAK
jgi:hypothetical protein